MIPGDIIDLLHQLLLQCPPNIWHAILTTDNFDYNLQQAINLDDYQNETVLLASHHLASPHPIPSLDQMVLNHLGILAPKGCESAVTLRFLGPSSDNARYRLLSQCKVPK
jgi:hypothetical protein